MHDAQKTTAEAAPAPAQRPSLIKQMTASLNKKAAADGTTADATAADKGEDKAKAEGEDAVTVLTEKIRDYIVEHQDDVAQEERWRTTMKRDMAKSFRKTDAKLQTVVHELHSLRARLDERDKKIQDESASPDETLAKPSPATYSEVQMVLTKLQQQRNEIDSMCAALVKMQTAC